MTKPFTCPNCGDEWNYDPRLLAACPDCKAKPGVGCKRPSGHSGRAITPHASRRRASFEMAPCSCLAKWKATQRAKGVSLEQAELQLAVTL